MAGLGTIGVALAGAAVGVGDAMVASALRKREDARAKLQRKQDLADDDRQYRRNRGLISNIATSDTGEALAITRGGIVTLIA